MSNSWERVDVYYNTELKLSRNQYTNTLKTASTIIFLETTIFQNETLATYFQKLNYNIIKYCEEKYPVQSKYSLDFESETKTNNKGKQKVKQHLKTTPNTPILPKTTAKHLQTPEQGTSIKLPLSITPFPISFARPQTPNLPLNHFFRPEDFQLPRNSTQQQEPILTNTNIIEYLQENESDHSENLESEETESKQGETTENKEEMTTAYIAKIPKFTGENNDTSPQEWLDKVQKTRDANTGLKNKLIKKVHPHVPADLATAIRHAKNYEMAMEEANYTKLINLTIGETSSAAEKKIDQLTKKIESYFTNQQQQQQQPQKYQPPHYYQPAPQPIQQQYQQLLPIQQYQTPPIQQYQVPARRLVQHNQFTLQNQFQNNNNRINLNNQLVPRNSGQQRPNYYHTQPSYFTIPEESDFQQTAFSEGEVAAPRLNSSNHTISPAQIAQNANLSDIFSFEFEANESPFLLSNAAVNEQKAITAMYTEAIVEGKPIHLILDSGSAGSIITYQLMQQLKQNVDRPAQTVIVTADDMKKTPIGEIDDFSFTIDGITIPVKVLVMDAPQYQALVRNDWLLKANANLN
ncbi:hypothetical protein G9A89_003603 [Geosiphon pyriformis]|nr:hypothetical protein G9A89_003603 [Geosiphon pyriformis]